MSLDLHVEPVTPATLSEHAGTPIAFAVERVLDVRPAGGGLDGISLTETTVAEPYVKDYDQATGSGPASWAVRFDTSNWALISARRDGTRAGGAVLAYRTPGVFMLGGRDDIAVLWDLRVEPALRGTGAGSALFRAAGDWARARGCGWLKIETQNVNVVACRFYRKMGCTLGGIDRFAYPDLPGEVQLLWWKDLAGQEQPSPPGP